MKPRHATALALVGWYLLMPSITYSPKVGWALGSWWTEEKPDFASWQIVRSYDSAGDCERARKTLSLKAPDDAQDREGYARQLPMMKSDAVCISTDDPRLKGN
jgi:hypothetical protein